MYLIRSGALEGFERLVTSLGVNPHTLLKHVGLSSAQLRQPDALVSYTKLADLLDISAHECQHALFGLRLAADHNPLVIGELALASRQQASLRDSLHHTNQHLHLHAHGVHLEHRQNDSRTEIGLQFDFSNNSGLQQLRQLSCAQLHTSIAAMVPEDEIPQLQIHLQQSSPSCHWQPARRYGKIHFDGRFDGVSLPSSWLQRAPQYDPHLLRSHFAQRVQLLENRYPNNLQAQVCYILSDLLSSGECTLERVGAALGLHPRVLQKRLQAQELNFRQLLQQSRLRLAQQHLQHSDISITDLALHLGYAEVSVFSRNFKSWTGYSPRQWRKDHRP